MSRSALVSFSVLVLLASTTRPADAEPPGLVGLAFSSQAIQFGQPPFELSNAQDFTIGGF